MKKLITMAVAILITACIAAFAAGTPAAAPNKLFDYQLSFSKIVVYDDIDLVLRESNEKAIAVDGTEGNVSNLDWRIKGGVLYIASNKGSLKNKVKVTLNVNRLKEIIIRGESKVSSTGSLISPALYVYMQADCYVNIVNTGKIIIIGNPDTNVEVEKKLGDVQVGR